jgi:hypothetical protein
MEIASCLLDKEVGSVLSNVDRFRTVVDGFIWSPIALLPSKKEMERKKSGREDEKVSLTQKGSSLDAIESHRSDT